jgi:hypothetical protein
VNGYAVAALNVGGRPADISGLIVAIVVDAIYRMKGRRPLPNVSDKCFEIIAPTGAHFDPAPCITTKFSFALVCRVASNFYAQPNVIKRVRAHRVCLVFRSLCFAPYASTRSSLSVNKVKGLNTLLFGSAIAITDPSRRAPSGISNDDKPPEPVSDFDF